MILLTDRNAYQAQDVRVAVNPNYICAVMPCSRSHGGTGVVRFCGGTIVTVHRCAEYDVVESFDEVMKLIYLSERK